MSIPPEHEVPRLLPVVRVVEGELCIVGHVRLDEPPRAVLLRDVEPGGRPIGTDPADERFAPLETRRVEGVECHVLGNRVVRVADQLQLAIEGDFAILVAYFGSPGAGMPPVFGRAEGGGSADVFRLRMDMARFRWPE